MSRQQSMNSWRGYLAATIGGTTGAVVLTALCFFLGYVYARTKMSGGLEGLVVLLWCSYAGFWIGEVLGCWLALHFGGYANALRTTHFLGWLTFFATLVFFSNIPMAFTGGVNNPAFWLLVGLTFITLPLLARFLAR